MTKYAVYEGWDLQHYIDVDSINKAMEVTLHDTSLFINTKPWKKGGLDIHVFEMVKPIEFMKAQKLNPVTVKFANYFKHVFAIEIRPTYPVKK